MKRISRHKALVIERKIRDQQEIEEAEEAEQAKQAEQAEETEAEQLEDCVQGSGQADQADKPASEGEQGERCEQVDKPTSEGERGEQGDQVGAPTTQFERMLELAAVVDSVVPDCDAIIAGPVDELEYADAFEAGINYYVRLDGLYTDAMHRREDLLKQLELYRQGLGRHLRQVSDDIIDGEFSETKEEAPSITGPDGAPQ